MSLSDACAEFLEDLSSGSVNAKDAVKQLATAVERYGTAPWDYDLGEIAALREACTAVLAMPTGANASRARWLGAIVKLVVLAERVRAYHDTPSSAWAAQSNSDQTSRVH